MNILKLYISNEKLFFITVFDSMSNSFFIFFETNKNRVHFKLKNLLNMDRVFKFLNPKQQSNNQLATVQTPQIFGNTQITEKTIQFLEYFSKFILQYGIL